MRVCDEGFIVGSRQRTVAFELGSRAKTPPSVAKIFLTQ